MQLARLITTLVALASLVVADNSPAAPTDGLSQPSAAALSAVRGFPAWKFLPTDEYATLSDRFIGRKRWVLYVYKAPSSAKAPRRTCLKAITISARSVGVSALTSRSECGILDVQQGFVVSQSVLLEKSAIGVVTAQSATQTIEMQLSPVGRVSHHDVKRLSQQQARKSGLPPLRYSVAVEGGDCLEYLRGLDGNDQTVFATGARGCSGI